VFNLQKPFRVYFTILLALLSLQTINSQALVKLRSTLDTGGSSRKFELNGREYFIQQSIGQTSVIGLSQDNNYLLRQGFIQPLKGSAGIITSESLPATVFPNPFSSDITISFTEEISGILYLTLMTMNGKVVFLKKYGDVRELNLDVSSLAPSVYILKVSSGSGYYYSKLVKL